MTSIVPTSWVSPQQIVAEQNGKISGMLQPTLPRAISSLVVGYLPPPAWYDTLEKINALPARVPPFTRKMEQILSRTCPIYGAPHTISDSFNLYLFPAGQIQNVGALAAYCGIVLVSQEFFSATDDSEIVALKRPRWFLVSKQCLPSSENASREQQMAMIEKLKKISDLKFRCLRFSEAMAALCLEKNLSDTPLWLNATNPSGSTIRVLECYVTPDRGHGKNLLDIRVGSLVEAFPYCDTMNHNSASPHTGMAVGLELEPEPVRANNASCCAIS